MEPTLMLEVAALVAVSFEVIKRFIQHFFSPKNTDFIFRALVVLISFAVAAAYKFYFEGHPEIIKTGTQLAVSAAGIWALVIKLLPTQNKRAVTRYAETQ